MTTAAIPLQPRRSAAAKPVDDLLAWTAWLQENVDPAWRPTEWNHSELLFTADCDNPRTQVLVCAVRACRQPMSAKTYCRLCTRAFVEAGLGHDEFVATFVPQRQRLHEGLPSCGVPGCVRDTSARGMCSAHYQGWFVLKNRPETDADFQAWLSGQRPYEALPSCRIRGCRKEETQPSRLCSRHRAQWRDTAREQGESVDDAAALALWAEYIPPYLSHSMFSLAALREAVRLEVLYVLQQRDMRGRNISAKPVRGLVRRLIGVDSIALAGGVVEAVAESRDYEMQALFNDFRWTLAVALDQFRGVDPTRSLVWDLRTIVTAIPSLAGKNGELRNGLRLDFGEIRQEWLREATMHWARHSRPDRKRIRLVHKAAVHASRALDLRPGGGADPGTLGYADMTAIVDAFGQFQRVNGGLAAAGYQADVLSAFFEVLDFGRLDGALDHLSPRFVRHKTHVIKVVDENEDEIGKALPESVIRQLDQHLHRLGEGVLYGDFAPEVVKAIFQTVYVILRETGRRPKEIAELSLDCLEFDSGDYQLIWDNNKGRRLRRRLPVYSETVDAINAWKKVRATLDLPKRSAKALFPPLNDRFKCMDRTYISRMIRVWVDALPALDSEELDEHGVPVPFDRLRVFPYAFRHSFCQRYADAGFPLHVLQSLMDHRSPTTTASYYRVSAKMKREAMDVLRLRSMDRNGRPAPMASSQAYELRSVQVPFGNCVEPTNVKAGGKACPIRFQCAGCGSYRPDPSHLPAIEDQVRSLKANLEIARTMGVAEYTIKGIEGEIADYSDVIAKMKATMGAMSEEERREVEEASKILRRLRAGSAGSTAVPLPMPRMRHAEGSAP